MMKKTLVVAMALMLLLTATALVSAKTGPPAPITPAVQKWLRTPINVDFKGWKLDTCIATLCWVHKFKIMFQVGITEKEMPTINYRARDEKLSDVLDGILAGTEFKWRPDGDCILIVKKTY